MERGPEQFLYLGLSSVYFLANLAFEIFLIVELHTFKKKICVYFWICFTRRCAHLGEIEYCREPDVVTIPSWVFGI